MLNLVSIGGNALETSKTLKSVLNAIYFLSKQGNVIITHGNGPQVGELAGAESLSLGLLTAQTQAQIGVMLEEEIAKYLKSKSVHKQVEVVLTRVLVDPKDAAFKNPTKPIGKFYNAGQARALRSQFKIKKLINGYRRVVASPKPMKVLNLGSIKALLKNRYIVIAGGGGGVPIVYRGGWYDFADAVLDKDYTSALLAKSLGADNMFILTATDGAYINFGKKGAKKLLKVTTGELSRYVEQGHFEEGSMKPKVEACIDFVRSTGCMAAIGNLNRANQVVRLRNCTVVRP
ncbi:MAG: hypothetical protein KGH61_03915 [Candidatus Micrarchaeota archaeon]|nr:hypothetical protein [Candidatus Micrarchaeota archaeon]MDE1848067.1 hypothetical protein [Candidatus Micrarchaeota archaeon]MDE1864615.1 hypothetical protein [Candidatus Micrarchaeota archaeon]